MPQHPTSGMSVAQGAALTIGAVLGTGVISLPAMAAGIAGPASILAWLALVVLSAPLAMTFAALGARFPDAGGVSTYARRAFGRPAATAVGWLFYVVVAVGAPPAAAFAGGYVADLVGGSRTTTMWAAGVIIAGVAVLNWFGVRISGRVQLGMAILLAVLLTVATVAALPHADLGHLTPFAPNGWGAIAPAAAVVVWGFAGWEAVTSLTADYRNPARDVPRAAVVAVVVVGVLYLGVVATSILVLGPRGRGQPGSVGRAPRRRLRRAGSRHHDRGRRAADRRRDERLLRRWRQARRGARPGRLAAAVVRAGRPGGTGAAPGARRHDRSCRCCHSSRRRCSTWT